MLYGCETWTITKVAEAKILAFERKCYRKILRIGWMQKVTNAELYRRIDLKENLVPKIIIRKLQLVGHICRMENDRKIKLVHAVFGRLEGTNKRGRPHKEWMDNITGMLILVLVLKDSLRTFFKSLSLSWSLGVRSLSLSLSLGVLVQEVLVLVLVLGGQVLVLILVLVV